MSKQEHILVLEDDLDMLESLTDVLESEGYLVTPVSNGQAAVKEATRQEFDLVVADIRMRGMDGITAVELSQQKQDNSLATLFVSGYATPENTAQARRLQAGAILSKPFRVEDFLELVQEKLADKRQLRARLTVERRQRENLGWSLEALMRALDSPALARPVSRFRELASSLSLAVGLSTEAAYEIGLAAALAAAEDFLEIPECFVEDRSFLIQTRYCLDRFQEPTEELGPRIVAFSLAAVRNPETLNQLDPELQAVFNKLEQAPANLTARAEATSQRGVLSLAQTFQSLKQLDDARAAYQTVLKGAPSGERVEALLGLAELALEQDQKQVLLSHCEQAVGLAETLTPEQRASALLKCGLLCYQVGRNSSNLLLRAVETLRTLRFRGSVALAHLALHDLGHTLEPAQLESCLQILSQPRYAEEVSSAAGWLLPASFRLLNISDDPNLVKAILLLLASLPGRALTYLERSPAEVKRQVLEGWAQHPDLARPRSLLESLSSDADPQLAAAAASLSREQTSTPTLRCLSLGKFEVFLGAEKVPRGRWRGKKCRYLFAFLASQWGTPVSGEVVMDTFWPDLSAEKARRNLYWSNSMIRRCLSGDTPDPTELILREEHTISLNPNYLRWHDLEQFTELACTGKRAFRQKDFQTCRRVLASARELYKGPFLQGYDGEWALARRRQLAAEFEACLKMLALSHLQLGETGKAEEVTHALLRQDPASEEGHAILMGLYLEGGEPARAIRQYDECRQLLEREYGLVPGEELELLYQKALSLGEP